MFNQIIKRLHLVLYKSNAQILSKYNKENSSTGEPCPWLKTEA